MSRNITAMSFDAGEPNLNSFTSKVQHPRVEENTTVLEEIKEINNLLIDTEVVIGEKDNIGSIAGGYAKHSEGLVVKFMFNALTINQDLISHYGTDKK
ncbi:putative mediator of RNA polymerase II transcription subunit, partial [Sesbania bispinosa]